MNANLTVAAAEPADGFVGWVVGLMEVLGGPGVGLAIALENLFPPIPSEAILPTAGFAASRGELGLAEVLVWATVGSVVGALALYGLGAWLGRERFRALASRVPLVKMADIDRTEAWFERHGPKAVLLGRLIPVFRSFISIPAGIERMSLPLFLGLTTLGSAVWNTLFVLVGYHLGEQWHIVEGYVGVVSRVVLAAVAAAVVWFVVRRVLERRRERRTAPDRGPRHG
ncbi:DedA family protein [Nocardiopsis sp. L17-MgMaSL7]|uniref:DedA family protein n=1 Tax=Nocardiopsis sp. L17-MgMaSL7 TaxID=1938893 RepID=UPI000D948AF1|nr:DedA family protein [Nocardiopsis sp. L17-MgMaSL7]PWV44311.1 membrane protein DedA with SNARE-associated domain [Nocardiopsis sp. L17-MgMaSL7]